LLLLAHGDTRFSSAVKTEYRLINNGSFVLLYIDKKADHITIYVYGLHIGALLKKTSI